MKEEQGNGRLCSYIQLQSKVDGAHVSVCDS